MTDDEWQLKATQSAIDACRSVVSGEGINARASIGSLSDIEWGWIVAASVFAWIKTRAEQAVAEGTDYEIPIRSMHGRDLEPWEAGAVSSILPALGNVQGLNWEKPVGEWGKEEIVSFAWQIHKLTVAALAARDEAVTGKIVSIDRNKTERELSAADGGPVMTRRELDDEIPF